MSLMWCENCKKLYGPTVPCPTCGVMGSRAEPQIEQNHLDATNNVLPDELGELNKVTGEK